MDEAFISELVGPPASHNVSTGIGLAVGSSIQLGHDLEQTAVQRIAEALLLER